MKPKKNILSRFLALFLLLALIGVTLFFTLPLPGTIPVLMYHFVGEPQKSPGSEGNFVSEKTLEKQMAFLKRFRYRVISLNDYYAILRGEKRSQGREIVITFDDGNYTFADKAVPILKKYRFPVAMFLVSDLIKTGEIGSMKLETVKKVQTENPWVNFQPHTKTHAHLLETTDAQLKEELEVSKRELQEMLGVPMVDLTYPYGEFNQRVLEAAQSAGYRMAFTTGYKRLKGIPEGLFSRTRISMNDEADSPIIFWYYVSGLHQAIKGTREKIRNSFR